MKKLIEDLEKSVQTEAKLEAGMEKDVNTAIAFIPEAIKTLKGAEKDFKAGTHYMGLLGLADAGSEIKSVIYAFGIKKTPEVKKAWESLADAGRIIDRMAQKFK